MAAQKNLLARLLPPTRRTLATFPSQSEAIAYARQKLAETRSRLAIEPTCAGWSVRKIGGAA